MESSDKIIKTPGDEFPSRSKFNHYSRPFNKREHEINLRRLERYVQDESNTFKEFRYFQHDAEDVLEEIKFDSIQVPKLIRLRPELSDREQKELDFLFDHVDPMFFEQKIKYLIQWYENIVKPSENTKLYQCMPSSRGTRETLLHGRGSELKELREYVLSDRKWDVVSVVGMSSIGKTSLLQHLCNDLEVQAQFKPPIWFCASDGFDVTTITITIINQFKGITTNQNDLTLLQDALKPCLSGKQVLLVIDDVWIGNGNSTTLIEQWKSLLNSLKNAGAGEKSKVVFTTQEPETADILRFDRSLTLSGLSDDSCSKICKEWVGGRREQDVEEMAKMCKGLPLAANAVGGFLKRKKLDQQWDNLLQHKWRGLDEVAQKEILDPLRRAYHRLPPYLKQCFAYCSLFPEGYIFEKEYLVQLWVGQGFIENDDKKMPVDVGREYFDQLVKRFFFQFVGPNEGRFEMNYFLHELAVAQPIADKDFLRIDEYRSLKDINKESVVDEGISREYYGLPDISKNIRHISLVPPKSNPQILVQCVLDEERYLRSFLYIGSPQSSFSIRVSELFPRIKSLRVLDLGHTDMKELPISVIYLIHLRYLSLAGTKIETLPESISGLFNLQTLDLKHCSDLKSLPQAIKLLSNLHNLNLPKLAPHWRGGIPDGFEEMKTCDMQCKKCVRKITPFVR